MGINNRPRPVTPSVIWRFVLGACERINISIRKGNNCNNCAQYISRSLHKIQSPGIWSPLIATMNNIVDNLINHEQTALYVGIQPRQK